jgi:outer membrane protein OmpA-like peptidoglycan-associated protein
LLLIFKFSYSDHSIKHNTVEKNENDSTEIITSDKYSIDYEKGYIVNVDYHVYKQEFFNHIKLSKDYKAFLVDKYNRGMSNYSIISNTDKLLIFKANELVKRLHFRINELRLKTNSEVTNLELKDSIIRQTKFKMNLVKDLEHELISSDNIKLYAVTPEGKELFSNDILVDNTEIYLLSKEDYRNIKSYKFRTRYFYLEDGEDFSVLDTMNFENGLLPNVVMENIIYERGTNKFKSIAYRDLDRLYRVMTMFPNLKIRITSHSSYEGDAMINLMLSKDRAGAVVDYLVKKGVDKSRLSFVGAGESKALVVTKEKALKYKFLKEGIKLNEQFIRSRLKAEDAEIARSLSRRTEIEFVQ